MLLHHSQPSFVLCPLTIKPSSVHHNNLSFHHTKPYILVVIFPTATIYIFVPLTSSYMVFLFTTRTTHLHNLSLHHTNPNIPFKNTPLTFSYFCSCFIASQTGLRTTLMWCLYILIMLFYIYNHLSIRQSYNFIMFKHPWQYPTQCIFPPLNSLTNSSTHYTHGYTHSQQYPHS